MFIKIVLWMVRRLNRAEQKSVVMYIVNDIADSSDSSIDRLFAESIVNKCVASKGNSITAFIVKD